MKLQSASVTNVNAAGVVRQGLAAMAAGDRVFDFSEVVRCDTAAVACVIGWLRVARTEGWTLEFIGLPADLRSLAALYGVEGLLPPA
jgi:phospholipid transport system transporter-binding protein